MYDVFMWAGYPRWAPLWNTNAWDGGKCRAMKAAEATRRVDLNFLPATSAKTGPQLIACRCLIGDAIEERIVVEEYLNVVAYIVHTPTKER